MGLPGMPNGDVVPPTQGSSMPPEVRQQLSQLREDMSKMTAAALEASKNGDDEASKFKTMLATEIGEKIRELEEKHSHSAAACEAAPPFDHGEALKVLPPSMAVPPGPVLLPPGPMLVPPPGPLLPPPGPLLPPPPRLPGMPPPGVHYQDWQRMMMLYNPDMAVNITQQQALEYEQEKANSTSMEPEVIELAHHFNLTDRHARMLDEQLKKRNNTFDDDIAAMYDILKGAKNPADLLMVSIRWMAEGIFNGTKTPNPDVERIARKYKLDAPSACKLAEVLESRSDPLIDLRKISSHLERSNRPSALVMMMLKDLKNGNPVEESTKAPAIGSYLHKIEIEKSSRKSRSRGRGRSRSRGCGRSRSRGRGRSRSRGRGRSRGRSRSRGRGRSRSR